MWCLSPSVAVERCTNSFESTWRGFPETGCAEGEPIPVVGLIGLYVIINRPRWFLEVTNRLYDEGMKSAAEVEEEL